MSVCQLYDWCLPDSLVLEKEVLGIMTISLCGEGILLTVCANINIFLFFLCERRQLNRSQQENSCIDVYDYDCDCDCRKSHHSIDVDSTCKIMVFWTSGHI